MRTSLVNMCIFPGAAALLFLTASGVRGVEAAPAKPSAATTAKPELASSPPLEFVLIPGGEFDMGSEDSPDEKPAHKVKLKSFMLSKTEVTVGQFRKFVEATVYVTEAEVQGWAYGLDDKGIWGKKYGNSWRSPGYDQREDFPVVNVSWNDAMNFCRWAGGRLPTEAQWEYAAGNGAKHSKYSWGNDPPAGRKGGNVSDETGKKTFADWVIFTGFDDGYLYAAPAARFLPNDFGLYDLTGNVWEWCADWYGEKYYETSPAQDPPGPSEGKYRVIRGGAWNTGPEEQRVANRVKTGPTWQANIAGFRVAKDAP